MVDTTFTPGSRNAFIIIASCPFKRLKLVLFSTANSTSATSDNKTGEI